MTNPTTLPPLPDWLDVDAGELGANEGHEWRKWGVWKIAAESIAGACGEYCGAWATLDPTVTPHACIARWAGEDAERWDRFGLALLTEFGKSAFDGYQDDLATIYALCNAKPHQLYRALVNVAWNPWRAEYNKQREAEEVRDEAE